MSDLPVLFVIDDDGFVGIEIGCCLSGDVFVKERVKPEVAGPWLVLGVSVAVGDDEVFPLSSIEAMEGLDAGKRCKDGFGSGDDVAGSILVPADDGFAVLNGFWKDHGFMGYGVC